MVFNSIHVVINDTVMSLLNKQCDIMHEILSTHEAGMIRCGDKNCLWFGSTMVLMKVEKQLESLELFISGEKQEFDDSVADEQTPVMKVDKAVECDILRSFTTRYGRQVVQARPDVLLDRLSSAKPTKSRRRISPSKKTAGRRSPVKPATVIREEPVQEESAVQVWGTNTDDDPQDSESDGTADDEKNENSTQHSDIDGGGVSDVSDDTRPLPLPVRRYEQRPRWFCSLCSFGARRKQHYDKHIQLHERGAKVISCDQCDFKAIRKIHLQAHINQIHNVEPAPCPLCDHTAMSARDLRLHQRRVHGHRPAPTAEPPQMCEFCDYTSDRPLFMQRHLRMHKLQSEDNVVSEFKCDECDYKTKVKTHFIRHKKNVHSSARPFLCDECGKSFKRSDTLMSHRHMHRTDNKPFTCRTCHKSYKSKPLLDEHMLIHRNIPGSHRCNQCTKTYRSRAALHKHTIYTHTRPNAFACHHCPMRFNTKFSLIRHINGKHAVRYENTATEAAREESYSNSIEINTQQYEAHIDQTQRNSSIVSVQPITAHWEDTQQAKAPVNPQFVAPSTEVASNYQITSQISTISDESLPVAILNENLPTTAGYQLQPAEGLELGANRMEIGANRLEIAPGNYQIESTHRPDTNTDRTTLMYLEPTN